MEGISATRKVKLVQIRVILVVANLTLFEVNSHFLNLLGFQTVIFYTASVFIKMVALKIIYKKKKWKKTKCQ